MAEVNTGGGHDKGKGKKVKQKKINLRVDFTPMVDMNMLLITFFMFATSLSKPQTMEINMPAKDAKVEDQTPIKQSEAVTIIMGGDNRVFYYFGMIDDKGVAYNDPNFLKETDYSPNGLRAMLLGRNRVANERIQALKKEKLATQMADSTFNAKKNEIWKSPGTPKVMIKAMDEANYKNLIDVIDEMQITNVGVYAIVDIQDGDKFLVNKYLGIIKPEDLKK